MLSPYARILAPPAGSFFLFGVRGVGKSTWTRQRFPAAHYVDLLDQALYQELLVEVGQFADELQGLAPGSWVVVDEIQRIPELLSYVHQYIERSGLRFVLLGSSARKLKAVGTNLLAGRALNKTMFPFVPEELGPDFSLDEALRFGTIPLIQAAADRKQTLQAYAQLYLQEEIKAEALVRNLPGFARFLPVAALCHGQLINVSGLARDAATARTTVNGYIEILEDTLVAQRLPAYNARLRVRERKHPKLYWVDPGIVRAIKKRFGPISNDEKGPLFEGLIFTWLRAYAQARELYEEIGYWSPAEANNLEVDFILRRGDELLAIEVKSSQRYDRSQLRGLRAIAEHPNVVRRILIYLGSRVRQTDDGIEIWPASKLASQLAQNKLWP